MVIGSPITIYMMFLQHANSDMSCLFDYILYASRRSIGVRSYPHVGNRVAWPFFRHHRHNRSDSQVRSNVLNERTQPRRGKFPVKSPHTARSVGKIDFGISFAIVPNLVVMASIPPSGPPARGQVRHGQRVAFDQLTVRDR